MKCQKCTKAATLHITEVLGEEQFEELHLCEECADKYLYEPPQKGAGPKRRHSRDGSGRRSDGAESRSARFAASSSSSFATPAGSAARTITRSSARN